MIIVEIQYSHKPNQLVGPFQLLDEACTFEDELVASIEAKEPSVRYIKTYDGCYDGYFKSDLHIPTRIAIKGVTNPQDFKQ